MSDDWLEALCRRFEAAWQAGQSPRIEEFLSAEGIPRGSPRLRELLIELVMIEMYHRWRRVSARIGSDEVLPTVTMADARDGPAAHDRPQLEEYLRRFPDLGPLEQVPLDMIADEYHIRRACGDGPLHEEYLRRFPGRAGELERALVEVDADRSCWRACRSRQFGPELAGVPRFLAGYEIVRELGRGGMGAVYEATRKATGQRVALKVIVPAREIADHAVRFFLREASTLSQLKHKRIVQFYEVGMIGTQFFLAMEYVDTIDVKRYLEDRAPEVQVGYYCGIVCQVLDALRYAHRQGVVHRDVKPSNILVSRFGRKLRTKLADFGLAKNFQNAGFSDFTREGERRGTLPFMPPEQVTDSRYAKPAADIYSTGATLYYYLADRYPYDFTQSASPFAMVLEQDPIPLASVRPHLPAGLVEAVHKAMARDPAGRFCSAEEMYRAIYPYAKRSDR